MQMHWHLFSCYSHVLRVNIPCFKQSIQNSFVCTDLSHQHSPVFLSIFCLLFLQSMAYTVRQANQCRNCTGNQSAARNVGVDMILDVAITPRLQNNHDSLGLALHAITASSVIRTPLVWRLCRGVWISEQCINITITPFLYFQHQHQHEYCQCEESK